mgnify:CR=1 FL=1
MVEQYGDAVYREVQRWSLKFRLLVCGLCVLGAAGGAIPTAMVLMRGEAGWRALLVGVGCGVLVPIGVGLLIWVFRLETEVRVDGVYIRCVPFHRGFKRFEAAEVSEHHARKYRPILEYGGWGIRRGWKGRAYNVSGNEGVQLVLRDGRRVLIGSARPCELDAAIGSIMHAN